MELLHQKEDIIAHQYRVLDTLGQGGSGTTYLAQDLKSTQQVALKALSLHRMTDWKMMELFEREAKILSQLNHPGIPQYLGYFQVETLEDRYFYIAQQLAEGKTLAALMESGWRISEDEVRRIAIQILEILVYLHSLKPPVVHRDIKPQNIIRRDDGRVFLVDFGAVQHTYYTTFMSGSTVVGTYGYMAPEQFRGQAFPASDLYGLATTLLFLLTGKSPIDLPQHQLKIDFRPYVNISQDLKNWLEQMLEPVSTERFFSAEEALATLLGQIALIPRRPKKSHVILSETEKSLIITIPPGVFYNNYSFLFLFFSIISPGILGLIYWIIVVDYVGGFGLLLIVVFLLPLSPGIIYFISVVSVVRIFILKLFKLLYKLIFFKPLSLFITYFFNSVSTTLLKIEQDYISIERWLFGWCIQKIKIPKSDIISMGFNDMMGYKFSNLVILYIVRSYRSSDLRGENIETFEKKRYFPFGAFLTQQEKEWLLWEIKNHQ